MRTPRASAWLGAAGAAFAGWVLATVLLLAGARSLGWVAIAAVALALLAAALYARTRGLRAAEVAAFALACLLLASPVLGLVTLVVLSWAGVAHWG